MDHESLRHFADTWGLVFLVIVFTAAVGFLFRPGARAIYRRHAELPFDED